MLSDLKIAKKRVCSISMKKSILTQTVMLSDYFKQKFFSGFQNSLRLWGKV